MQVLGDAGLAFEKRCRSATKSGLKSRLESGQLVHLLRIRGKLWLSKLERDLEGGGGSREDGQVRAVASRAWSSKTRQMQWEGPSPASH